MEGIKIGLSIGLFFIGIFTNTAIPPTMAYSFSPSDEIEIITQPVITAPASATPGSTINVSFTAPTGSSAKDWIGLYAAGAENTSFGQWHYTAGATSGILHFTAPTQPGSYEFRYLVNNGFTSIARASITIAPTITAPTITAPASATPGSTINVSFTAPTGSSAKDWIGLYAASAENTSFGQWHYTAGATSGILHFTAPTQPGSYEFRYLVNNGFTSIARASITIAPTITAPASATPGSTINVSFTAPTGSSAKDWIGLYAASAENTSFGQWHYTAGATSGMLHFTAPTQPGSYEFRYLVNNGFSSIARASITITAPASLVLSANPSSLAFGSVNVGSSSLLSATLTNSGNSSVTISNVSISGAGFSVTGVSTGQILAPGQTATLNVTFAPTATVDVTGSVVVASNASNSPATVSLSGRGVQVTTTLRYVRAGATGANNGTDWTNAWTELNRIQYAAGGTVYVGAGTYNTGLPNWSMSNATVKRATVSEHGANSGWQDSYDGQVTVTESAVKFLNVTGGTGSTLDGVGNAATGWKWRVVGQNAFNGKALIQSATNFTFRGIELDGNGCQPAQENGPEDGLRIGGVTNLKILENYIHDYWYCTYAGINNPGHSDGIQMPSAEGAEVAYNVFKNSGMLLYFGDCVWADQWANNVDVHHNVLIQEAGVANNYAMLTMKGAGHTAADYIKIQNNTLVRLGGFSGPTLLEDGCPANTTQRAIKNNIFSSGSFALNSGWGTRSNNNYFGGDTSSTEAGVVKADPQFVNPAGLDFHLRATSPVINKGADLGYTRDIAGVSVDFTPSMGAYE